MFGNSKYPSSTSTSINTANEKQNWFKNSKKVITEGMEKGSCYWLKLCPILKPLFLKILKKNIQMVLCTYINITIFSRYVCKTKHSSCNFKSWQFKRCCSVIIITHKKCIVAITTASSHVQLPEKLKPSLISQIHGPKHGNKPPIWSWHLLSSW